MDPKQALRRDLRRRRAALTPAALSALSEAITHRLLTLPEVQRAERVFCYVSVRREIPTRPLITALLAKGVEVSVPYIAEGRMTARRLISLRALVPGPYDIPTAEGPTVDRVDAAICPGLAFDARGNRLGYGAAYYDRWLTAHPEALPIAIAMDAALVPTVPTHPHDRPMACVVTESRTVIGLGSVMTHGAIRVVAGVWVRDGRVLVALRPPGRPCGDRWELPGGKVEPGETDAQALARELREELQADVEVHGPVAETVHQYGDVRIHLVALHCTSTDTPRATEHVDLQWIDLGEVTDRAWADADRRLLAAVTDWLSAKPEGGPASHPPR